MTSLDFDDFDVLTFDCYGTLIDWEAGLLDAFRAPLAAHGIDAPDAALLEAFARHEAELEAGPYRRYRDVLGGVLTAMLEHFGQVPTREEVAASVARWSAGRPSPIRRGAGEAADDVQAGRHHELRRRPLCRLGSETRR